MKSIRKIIRQIRIVILLVATLSAGGVQAQTITELGVGIAPFYITAGPDGNLWFTERESNRIGRITPAGVITEFSTDAWPLGITAGPDGNLWFTEKGGNRIGRITPAGVITEFSTGISVDADPRRITAGPDGNLWFTESERIGRITPAGVITEFSAGISAGANPYGITTGPDGNLWFTEFAGDRIGRITAAGVITEFSVGISAGANPHSITTGTDGNLWFTEYAGNRIGRITPVGVVTEFSVGISTHAGPAGITAGPDGNLWFTENEGNRIGRITPSGIVTEFSAGISANAFSASITAGPDGNLWFAEQSGNRIGRVALPSLSGLWWNPNESDWGISIAQHGSMIFAGIYTYDQTGKPLWLVMSNCPLAGTSCTGDIYVLVGGASPAVPWDGSGKVVTKVGTGTIAFNDSNNASFTYVISGNAGSKSIMRELFATGAAAPAVDYTDLWGNPNESGWGVFLAQQFGIIFAAWHTYDAAGNAIWYVASDCPVSGTTCSGDLYQVNGGSPLTSTWKSCGRAVTKVGSVTFAFGDARNGTMTYTLNGVTASRAIAREPF